MLGTRPKIIMVAFVSYCLFLVFNKTRKSQKKKKTRKSLFNLKLPLPFLLDGFK